jgi:hypothetical protein
LSEEAERIIAPRLADVEMALSGLIALKSFNNHCNHAAIARSASVRIVRSDWLRLSKTTGRHATRRYLETLDELRSYRVGALLGEIKIVSLGSTAVGMPF